MSTDTIADPYVLQAIQCESLIRNRLNRFTHGSSEVPDLLQETYCRLLGWSRSSSVEIQNVRSLVLHIARNVAIDWIRHRDSRIVDFIPAPEELNTIDPSADVEAIHNSEEQLERLAEIVRNLSPACRRVFTLRKVYGLRQAEVAEHLGISKHTVEAQLAKAARLIAGSNDNRQARYSGPTLQNPFSRRAKSARISK